jgi:outer membrane protein
VLIQKGLKMKQFGIMMAAMLILGASAFAQATPTPTNVGLIDFQRAVSQNDEGVKAANALTEIGNKLKQGLVASQTKVTDLQDKLAKAPATTTDSEKTAMTREIDKAKKVYEVEQQDALNTMDDKQEELFRPIADRVKKVVEVYAKELNLVVVLNGSQDILFANDLVDITTEILRRVNADIAKNPAKK